MKAIKYEGRYIKKIDNDNILVTDEVYPLLDDGVKRYKKKLNRLGAKYEVINLKWKPLTYTPSMVKYK